MKFDVWKDIVSQSSYFKSRLDPVRLGGIEGEPKILENTWSGGIGMKLGGKISTSPRYVIDITGIDLLSLGSGGRVNSR